VKGFLPEMSIRLIALELYGIMKEVEALERLGGCPRIVKQFNDK
jgi:hypothetical protein